MHRDFQKCIPSPPRLLQLLVKDFDDKDVQCCWISGSNDAKFSVLDKGKQNAPTTRQCRIPGG
jgi:hypothetical protein